MYKLGGKLSSVWVPLESRGLMKCRSTVLCGAHQKGASAMAHTGKTIKFNWNYVVISKCSCVGVGQNKKIYVIYHLSMYVFIFN